MGLFGSKKVTVVSSVIYNLLGDEKPVNYVSTSILDAVINPKNDMSLSENLFNKITSGPAANFRKYIQWSKNSNYQKYLGLATSSYYNVDVLSNSEAEKLIKKYLNLDDSVMLIVTKTEFARYNMYLFADAWIINNKPDQKDTNYIVEDIPVRKYPSSSIIWNNPIIRYDIVITFTDGSSVTIDTSSFDTSARYLYIQYYILDINNNTDIDIDTDTDNTITTTTTYGFVIYKQGSGFTEFDVLFSKPQALENTYSAFLPFRAWNTFLSDEEGKEYLPEVYSLAKKGANIAIGDNKYTELMDIIANNKDIGEIDFAYLHFGVPLNIPYDFGKEYIFEYFNNIADYNTEFGKLTYIPYSDLYVSDESSNYYEDYYGTIFDGLSSRKSIIPGTVYIRSPGTNLNFNITINWDHITKTTKQGLVKPDAKVGKFYVWNQREPINIGVGYKLVYVDSGNSGAWEQKSVGPVYTSAEVLYIAHQETSNRYTEIQVWSAEQLNYIYGGKYTATYSDDAFADKDLSDFIIPIQYNSFLETNMAKMDNTMQCCYNLVFNCYKVKKKKWYQTGLFGFVVIIVAIIITVVACYINPALGAAVAKGLSATVGGVVAGTMTVSMAAYIAIAMAVNAIVAIALSMILIPAAQAIFGEKLGLIIGTIIIIVLTMGTSFTTNGISFSVSNITTSISSNPGLFTASVAMQGGNVYAQLLGIKAQSVLAKINNLYLSYQDKMEEIQEKTDELLGYNQYSPLFLSSILDPEEPLIYEDRDTFLTRTLMVGSDIVDLTLTSITNFTKLNLNLELI